MSGSISDRILCKNGFLINSSYLYEEFSKHFLNTLLGFNDSLPFPCFALPNFLADSRILSDLVGELHSAKWIKLENDLYSLEQTDDFKNFDESKSPFLTKFREFLRTDVRKWLSQMSKIDLSDEVAITGSRYGSCDHLLTHDDRLEGRAFAFAFYLSSLDELDGGELCLFDADPDTGHPRKLIRKIKPSKNTLSLFPVRTNSWHCVAEVQSNDPDKIRLSINGWFHFKTAQNLPDPKPEGLNVTTLPLTLTLTRNDVFQWFNPGMGYTKYDKLKQIRKYFGRNSQIFLQDFLEPLKYKGLTSALDRARFEIIGPPNKRHFGRIEESSLPENSIIKEFINVLRSSAFGSFLNDLTGLDFNCCSNGNDGSPRPKARRVENVDPGMKTVEKSISISIERWSHACYSMADDQLASDAQQMGSTLDLLFFFGMDSWSEDYGGFTVYFEPGEKDELSKIVPSMGSVALIFREPDILTFTKYINHRSKRIWDPKQFHLVRCSYHGFDQQYGGTTSDDEDEEESLDLDEEGSYLDEESLDDDEEEFDGAENNDNDLVNYEKEECPGSSGETATECKCNTGKVVELTVKLKHKF